MISTELIIISTAIYLAMMFFIAFRVDKRDQGQFSRFRPLIYTLSLAVYCTSWTFYGAVGTAASSGWSFFTIYLGPIIVYTLFFPFIRKIIAIAKRHKTTSIADFLATRYGKSSLLAALVTLIAFVGTLPYIALQIKAISSSFDMLTAGAVSLPRGNFQNDTAFMLALILAAFSILFGARTVDASQHHKGLIYAIAFESVIKIVAFLAIAVMAYNLLDSLSQRDPEIFSTHRLLWLPFETLDFKPSMLTTLLLAAGAIFLLPRQFHVLAVEAKGGEDASRWGLPVYLLLFSVAVIPITSAGLMVIGSEHHADLYVLLVPMSQGNDLLSVFAYLGGFAAATGMVIVATLALSTMVSNDLIVPVLVRYYRNDARQQMHQQLLLVRRATILLILMLAYGFYAAGGTERSLQSIGLVSFAAAIQFLPSFIGSVYWYRGHKHGAIAGLLAGTAIWFYSMFLPSLAGQSWMPDFYLALLQDADSLFNPHSLLGFGLSDPVTHGVFWSLTVNTLLYVYVSLRSRHQVLDRLQAAAYIDQGETISAAERENPFRVGDLFELCSRFTGEERSRQYFSQFGYDVDRESSKQASSQFTSLAEQLLASSIGNATASTLIRSLAISEPATARGLYEFIDQTGQAIEFNRELLQVTLDHIGEAVSVVDRDLRLIAWNRQYIDFFAYEPGFIRVGRPIAEVIRHNIMRGMGAEVDGDLEQHVNKRLELLRNVNKYSFIRDWQNGKTVQTAGARLPDGGYITTYTDITPLKKAEKRLAAINETLEAKVLERTEMLSVVNQQLEELLDTRRHFLAAASHDLIQPLGASKLYLGVLREELAEDPQKLGMADNAFNAIKTAESLLKSLLHLSKMDSGLLTPEFSEFPLQELFDLVENEFAPTAETKQLILRIVPTGYVVRSDRSLLLSILQNLVANAVRYTRQGSVMLLCRRRGDYLQIEIRDSGDGIARDRQQEIFQAFRQLENGDGDGVGLGLAICRKAADLLSHPLSLYSCPQRGSNFSLLVPWVARHQRPGNELENTVDQPAQISGLAVLAVDDDRLLLDASCDLMKRWGMQVESVDNVKSVTDIIQQKRHFDIVLMDYQLDGEVNGLELLKDYQRETGFDFLGVLATAVQSQELVQEVEKAGFVYLAKPVGPSRLRSVFQSYVNR